MHQSIFCPRSRSARASADGDGRFLLIGNHSGQLPFDAGQLYGITFSASGHRPAWQMIRRTDFIRTRDQIEVDDLILRLMERGWSMVGDDRVHLLGEVRDQLDALIVAVSKGGDPCRPRTPCRSPG